MQQLESEGRAGSVMWLSTISGSAMTSSRHQLVHKARTVTWTSALRACIDGWQDAA